MATTTPDGIRSPNDSDQYALVQDLGVLAQTTQDALNKRANSYIGTAAQRNAFTTAPEGTSWQDTDGNKYRWTRQGGAWVGDTGWLNIAVTDTGWTTQIVPAAARLKNGVVYFRGVITKNTFTGGFTDFGTLPAGIPGPSDAYAAAAIGGNGAVHAAMRATTDGRLQLYRSAPSTTYMVLNSLSYPVG